MVKFKKELQELIQQNQSVSDFIFESALDGFWYMDLVNNGKLLVSPKFWNKLGYDHNNLPFKSTNVFEAILNPDDAQLFREEMQQHLDDPAYVFQLVLRLENIHGKTVWMDCKGTAVRSAEGTPLQMIGSLTDITPLKQKEEILERCNTAARIGYWEVDLVKNKIFWSRVTKEIHGVAPDFMPDLETALNFYEEGFSKDIIRKLVEEAVTNNTSYEQELVLVTISGEKKWVKTIGIPEFENGVCTRLYGTFQDIDERKRSQLALLENEQKFRGIFNSTFSFIGFMTPQGVLLEANLTALSMAGLQPEDVIGKYFWDCYWWQISEETKATLKKNIQLAAEGQEVVYEVTVWIANKTPITIYFSLRPVFDADGKVIYIIPEGRPVQDIVDARNRYKSVIDGTNVGTWEWNVQTGETTFNERWAEIVGYTLEELAPISIETWAKLAHPDDLEDSNKRLTDCFEKKALFYECECRMKHKDGHWVWVFDKGKVFSWTDDGKPLMMYGTHQDITERKSAEERLMISEQAFRSNFEHAAVGMAILDTEGKWVKVNKRLSEIVGYSEEELATRSFREITHPDDLDADLQLLQQLIDDKITHYQMEKRYIHKDGHVVYIILAASVVRDLQGKILYFIAQTVDISDFVESKKALDALNHELSMKNEELEQYAHIVAHDLKEPLRSISSFLSLLEKNYNNTLDEKAKQYIQFAVDGALRMQELISDILQYSKSGIVENSDLDMNPLLMEITEMFLNNPDYEDASIAVQSMPVLYADRTAMQQLFTNLIGNGLKYQPKGNKAVIKVTAQEQKDQWLFCVADNGIGIAPEHYDKVFAVFKRLHSRSAYPGTGVGLATCKKIVQAYNGNIWIEPNETGGTVVCFTLPKK